MTRPNIAVIGLGAWGRNHLRLWGELGALRVMCDREEARVHEAQEGHPGVEGVTRVGRVLGHDEVDAVVIVSPAATHFEIARRALEAEKDVLVEKPLALTVAEGEELVRLARERGRILMVGHVLMYHPAVRELARLVKEGALGRIRYIYSNRLNLGRIRTEESSLWSFAPHDVALTLGLTGSLPHSVACHGGAYVSRDVADVTLTSLTFASEIRAHIYVSWLHPFKEQRFVVVGDRQMAVFDDTVDWDRKLLVYPHRVDWIDGQIPVAHRAEADPVPLVPTEPLRAECEHFLSCLRSRQTPVTDGVNALRVLRVLSAAQRSLDTGGVPVGELGGAVERPGVVGSPGKGQAQTPAQGQAQTPAQGQAHMLAQGHGQGQGQGQAHMLAQGQAHMLAHGHGHGQGQAHVQVHGHGQAPGPSAMAGPGVAAMPDEHVGRPDPEAALVHPTATIDEGVVLGERTRVWHYSHIMPGARVGIDCILGQNVYVGEGVTIGNRVKIQNNVSVYSGVTLEDEVFCGPSMVFTNVINPRSGLEKKEQFKPTRVCTGATLGANCTIVCGTTIGRHAMVGAGAVVTSNVGDHALVWGVPARQSGWVCRCGETLRLKDGQATCALCKQRYQLADGDSLSAWDG